MRLLPLSFIILACAAPAAGQDIVVTADRESAVEWGAGSAATLSSEDLAAIGAQVPSEALNRLPGVAIQRNNGVENLLAIRSPVLTGGQSAGSFLVLDNGVPVRAPGFANVNQIWETSFDFADRVTVLRGPGSSLYGSNAVHGVVHIQAPAFVGDVLSDPVQIARAWVDASSLGRSSAGGLVGAGWPQLTQEQQDEATRIVTWRRAPPRVHELTVGLAGEHDSGWRSQSGLDRQTLLIRYARGVPFGDRQLTATVAAQNLNQESAGFIEGARAYDSRVLAQTNPVPEAYRDTQLIRAQATLSLRHDDFEWRITPFARLIETDLNLFFFPSRAQETTRQIGAGVQASAAWEASPNLGVIVGLDVDHTRGELREFQARPTLGTFTQGLHYDYAVDMTAAGLYAQVDWAFAQRWTLTAGLRGEWVEYAYDNRAPDGDVGRFRRPADRTDRFEGLAPRLTVSRSLDDGRIWAAFARGVRPPQITDLYSLQTRQNPGEQGVETMDSLELGWRQDFATGAIEVVVFAMDKRDTSFRGADGFTVSGGRTRHVGVEASGEARFGQGWSLDGWVSYAEHSYRFDSPADGIVSGNLIDTAPRWLGNLRLRYAADSNAGAELEWAFVGESFTNAANSRVYEGHDVFTLRAFAPLGEDAEAFLALRNLTNTGYADRADFAFGTDRYFPGLPRSVSVGLRYRR